MVPRRPSCLAREGPALSPSSRPRTGSGRALGAGAGRFAAVPSGFSASPRGRCDETIEQKSSRIRTGCAQSSVKVPPSVTSPTRERMHSTQRRLRSLVAGRYFSESEKSESAFSGSTESAISSMQRSSSRPMPYSFASSNTATTCSAAMSVAPPE